MEWVEWSGVCAFTSNKAGIIIYYYYYYYYYYRRKRWCVRSI